MINSRKQITLKRLTFSERLSEETLAYKADIYFEGRLVGDASNDGRGGCDMIHWSDKEVGKSIEEFAKFTAAWEFDGRMVDGSVDVLLGDIINSMREEKRIKRLCKTKTVIKTTEDVTGTFRTLDIAYTPAIGQKVREKYGDKIVEIYNERFN